jgi:uncharacterized protein
MQQPEFLDALMEAAAFPHACASITRVETHISWVVLTGDVAYKIKKPVDFGFLNFATLERRRYFCHEELRCNRRFAPELYLDVVVIRRAGQGFVIGAADDPERPASEEVVDYAVRMRQFPGEAQLDCALAAGNLQAEALEHFADSLWAVHRTLPAAAGDSAFGTAAAVWDPVEENFRQLAGAAAAGRHRASLARLEAWSRATHRTLTPIFEERRRAGCVRECHGDLHLSNLVALPEGVRAFDCIEFSEALRWIDTISDVAFLVMDCVVRDRADLGYRFLNQYLTASGDYRGARLLGFYVAYRSLVRAKVAALQLADGGGDRAALGARLDAHVSLAMRYVDRAPVMLITCGYSGSGKSWLARALVPSFPALCVRSDVERKRMHGLAPEQRSHSSPGSGIYTDADSARVYAQLAQYAADVVAGGESVIVDAACLARSQRELFVDAARRLQVPVLILWAHCPEAVLAQRVTAREAAGRDASEAGMAVLRAQLARGLDLGADEPVLEIDTRAPLDSQALVRSVLQQLGRN